MNLSWKLLPLVAAATLGLLALMPGGGLKPVDVSAAPDCDNPTKEQLTIDIVNDGDSGNRVSFSGSSVLITPDPQGNVANRTYVDGGLNDDSGFVGRIRENAACPDTSPADYALVLTLPSGQSCTIDDNTLSAGTSPDGSSVINATFHVQDCVASTPTLTPTATGTPATATPTATGTPTGVNTISLSAVQPNPACGQAVFLFAMVKNSAGAFVPGVTVTFTTTGGGSFSPVSAVTVTDGVASSTYTPPTTGNATVTITATSGSQTSTATVAVNCGAAAATSTPVPAPSSVRPPSTGDAGLKDGSSLTLYASLAALVGVVFTGALVVARRKA